jgi:outer membrane protein, heavy metal efflux system
MIVPSTPAAQAQPQPQPVVASASAVASIEEAQLMAKLAASPRLALVLANVEAARADATSAAARPNPSVGYDREALLSDGGGATDYLRFSLPLEISGRRAARKAAADAEVAALTAESDGARFALTVEALRSFRLARYERARSELLRAERAALQSAVEVVRRRTAAGATSGYDLQRIELELAAYDDSVLSAETQLVAARVELGTWIGAPEGVDAAGTFALPEAPAPLSSLSDSLDDRPELRAAAARSRGADALAKAARRGWIPDLVLTAGLMNQDTANDSDLGYTAGLALTLPIFEHGQADRARAQASQLRVSATRELFSRTARSAIRLRHASLIRATERARSVEQSQLARLAQLLRSAETAYRDGAGNIVELVDAYATARDLRLRALELVRDAQLAQLELWLALGRRP